MSRFKIIAIGLLLAFAIGCNNTTDKKNTPKNPVFLEKGLNTCAQLVEEECMADKNCTFDAAKKTCADALKKNACENIQSPVACNKDQSCGGWDQGLKVCLEKKVAGVEKIVKLFNIDHVGIMGANQIDSLIVSHNQEWAYFVHNDYKNLTAFNIERADKLQANVGDATKWHHRLSLETKLGNDQEGRANLNGTKVLHQVATPKGALISLGSADNQQGVALLEGKNYVAAWKNDNGNNFFGVAMSKTTGEHYVSIFTQVGDKFVGTTNNVNINKLTNFADAQIKLDLSIEREDNPFSSLPASTVGYLVDNTGIVPVSDAQVGASVKFAALDQKNPDLGSDTWKFLKTPEKANNTVSSVAFVNNKLYIGLKSDNSDGTGGVVVYDSQAEAGKRVTNPHETWAKTSVIALAPDKHGSVWAVTPSALIQVKLSEKSVQQGQKIDADEIQSSLFTGDLEKDKNKAFVFNKNMAFETITGAQWIGDHLIITSKNGIHVWIYQLKAVK